MSGITRRGRYNYFHPPIVRFLEKIERVGNCWIWHGSIKEGKRWGYACFNARGYPPYGHQFAYTFYRGAVPAGLELDHLCRNRACVNPYHLEAVTHKTNILRGESIQAQNARKTHCHRGHPLTHFRRDRPGQRDCVSCRPFHKKIRPAREKQREYSVRYRHKLTGLNATCIGCGTVFPLRRGSPKQRLCSIPCSNRWKGRTYAAKISASHRRLHG